MSSQDLLAERPSQQANHKYNKNVELGIHHWGDDHQWFYKGSTRHKSAHDVYINLKIISVNMITVEKKYVYGYLKEIVVKRADKKEYTIVIKKRVEYAQLGVESYQKKLNLTKPQFMVGCLHQKVSYATLSHPKGVVYEGIDNQKLLMKADELHKFNDGTLNKVYNKLDVMLRDNMLRFGNEGMTDRKCTSKDKEMTKSIMEKIEKTLKERRRFRKLECFVCGRRNKTNYRLLVRPE
ncbi:hypothetical protein Tco_0787557 [Tanacetum coccineum]